VVDKLLFQFSICGSVPEIFAIKVESCQNRAKLWTIFALPNFWGRAFQNLYPVYHSCLGARRLKKFHEDTPTSPYVIKPNTLNFIPNFKYSRLFFFLGGGPRPPWGCGCALARLGKSVARVKILGRSTP